MIPALSSADMIRLTRIDKNWIACYDWIVTKRKDDIMSRPKKKPNYDADRSMRELTDQVVAFYGEAYDDRYSVERDHASLRDVAAEYKITILKARKILITAEMFSTKTSRNIQQLAKEGKSIPEIIELTGLSRASVHSYLPYTSSKQSM